jgi:Mce-associated membrane protein
MEENMSVATDSEPAAPGTDGDVEALADGLGESDPADPADAPPSTRPKRSMSASRHATLFGLVAVAALATLLCWLGFRAHQAQHEQDRRDQFLQAARQGALNLTTIDWQHADADVHRILDGATGEFYDDFSKRSQPFIDVLRQAKATTVGTVAEAGLESQGADTAQALVAVSVRTSNAGEADPVPRVWRMRVTVQKVGGQVKVSNVGFVQ